MIHRMHCVMWVTALSFTASVPAAVNIGDHAFYVLSPSVEGQEPPVSMVRIDVTGSEKAGGETLTWWELAAELRGGGHYGLRVCSQRTPMTAADGVGEIHRYIYLDADGRALEYRDKAGGKVLLPQLDFHTHFLPQPSCDARYDDGFASSGGFVGHVLTRVLEIDDLPRVDFAKAEVLDLRADFIVAVSAEVRHPEGSDKKDNKDLQAWEREDYEKMIQAGANYFHPSAGGHIEWLKYQPVYYRGAPSFPDSFYRSNYVVPRMYLDEPMVRLGWSGGIPGNAMGPEQVAEALRQRVSAFYAVRGTLIKTGSGDLGRFDPIEPNAASWDTDYWSAWYQLAAGAPALVHEARYEKHNYGWHPKELYGEEGLEGIGLMEQVSCMNAFLRGAARAFDGDWGTSGYPEGAPEFRIPAFKRAYDMGNRYLWFWTHYPTMSFDIQHEIIEAINDHARSHPRDSDKSRNAARVGIAFPSGYVFGWKGTWGMEREQLSRDGASFGEISAAGLWEGILCSLEDIEFDFLVDEPRIRDLGYEQLVIVKTDGGVEWIPPRKEDNRAGEVTLRVAAGEQTPGVAARMTGEPEYEVARATGITIDGKLDDWRNARWISLNAEEHGWPDKVEVGIIDVVNDLSNPDWNVRFKRLFGMSFEQVNDELSEKYMLDDFNGEGIVVTDVIEGSPGDKAGILEGDVIVGMGRLDPIRYLFRIWEFYMQWVSGNDGKVMPLHVQRSGRYDFNHDNDIAADLAMELDDEHLYVAVSVTDDVHSQRHCGWDYWKGDSLQIGFDPALERREYGYGEENQEFGFILDGDESVVWRYAGRRGQPLGANTRVKAKIVRDGGVTRYEAAIPLDQLAPMSPDLWPMCGFNIVINDSDGLKARKSRLELRRPAMTRGKRPKEFALMRFDPSEDTDRVSAALMWRKRATVEGGGFRLVVAAASPQAREATIVATLQSLDSPGASSAVSEAELALMSQPSEYSLFVDTPSRPGRYRLSVALLDAEGGVCVRDELPVYVYPDVSGEKWPETADDSALSKK